MINSKHNSNENANQDSRKRLSKEARQERLLKLISEQGLSFNISEAAKSIGCSRSALYADLQALQGQCLSKLKETSSLRLMTIYNRVEKECYAILSDNPNQNSRLGALNTLLKLASEIRESVTVEELKEQIEELKLYIQEIKVYGNSTNQKRNYGFTPAIAGPE
jgi:AraC-like DNA-binding protein